MKRLALMATGFVALATLVGSGRAQDARTAFVAAVPRTWDDAAVVDLELPLAAERYSPVHVSSTYYYSMPVRPVYKSYPIYAPGKEPAGYLDWLTQQEPEIVFDAALLKTEADWIRAGALVFEAPINYTLASNTSWREPDYYNQTGMLVAQDGTVPFQRYVIRKKGVVEVGGNSCANCHTRVMPDGSVVKGAQGNAAVARASANASRRRVTNGQGQQELAARVNAQRRSIGAPWLRPNPAEEYVGTIEESIAAREAVPPGLSIREGTSIRYAAQIPDLIGVKDRRYLDHTGLVRHRSIADLMRYAALNQDTQLLARYGDFIPDGRDSRELPDPSTRSRYSDEQLYALALYLYSLEPPPNPNQRNALTERGEKVFQSQGCAACHTPPLYTSNKLTPAEGFTVPEKHRGKYEILGVSVGTDPNLALKTRRGTGYYKVPSLRGVWYRGPLEHNGSVATLEDWFDPRRLKDDYIPTGYKAFGVNTRAVKGHPFGLMLSTDDRAALIAFLKTL